MKSIACLRGLIVRSAVIIVAFLLITSSTEGAIIFTDGTFNDADWTLTIQTLVNGGTATAYQSSSGGNPGEYRRIVNSVYAGPGSTVWGFHIRGDAVYDPSTQGAILSIDYTEDSILFVGSGDGQGTGPAISQGTKLYYYYVYGTFFANQST